MIRDFLKNPDIQFKQNKSFNDSLKDLFVVFFYASLFLFINYLLVSFIDFIIKSITHFSFIDAINHSQKNAAYEKSILFFLISAPILEELIFRLPLKLTRLNILISVILSYFIFYLSRADVDQLVIVDELWKYTIFGLICSLIIFSLRESVYTLIASKYFRVFFYGITLLFGLLHVSNFIDLVPKNLILLSPIFIFHQIIVGFFLGYIRLKRGMFWCILLHFLFNLLPTLSYFLNK